METPGRVLCWQEVLCVIQQRVLFLKPVAKHKTTPAGPTVHRAALERDLQYKRKPGEPSGFRARQWGDIPERL